MTNKRAFFKDKCLNSGSSESNLKLIAKRISVVRFTLPVNPTKYLLKKKKKSLN